MARTTQLAVENLLLKDYDSRNRPSLSPFIDSATVVVDRVVTCATSKDITLTTAEKELIERWLAAFLYTRSDPIYQSKNTDGAGGGFVQDPVDPERYRMGAYAVDYSGCLKGILEKKSASAVWLGKNPTQQVDYIDRR